MNKKEELQYYPRVLQVLLLISLLMLSGCTEEKSSDQDISLSARYENSLVADPRYPFEVTVSPNLDQATLVRFRNMFKHAVIECGGEIEVLTDGSFIMKCAEDKVGVFMNGELVLPKVFSVEPYVQFVADETVNQSDYPGIYALVRNIYNAQFGSDILVNIQQHGNVGVTAKFTIVGVESSKTLTQPATALVKS